MIRLSAPILNGSQIPAFSGSIEVDITAEDVTAQLGKYCLFVIHLYVNACAVIK